MIRIGHEEIPVLAPLKEPLIGTDNQLTLNISNGVVHDTQAQNLPTMEEVIAITTAYNVG